MPRSQIFALTLLVLLISTGLCAQNIRGTVRSSGNAQPVEQITVFLEGTSFGDVTDGSGAYRIPGVPAGSYWLVFTGVGFHTIHQRVKVDTSGDLILDITLDPLDIHMPEALVTAQSLTGGTAGLRQIPGAAHYIDPKEIGKFQYSDVHRLLQRVPGVQIQEEDGFGLRPNIGLRGTGVERSSKVTLMEDGILIAPAPYAAPAAYYFPTIGRMQGIEVMKGGSQVRFGPFTTGGAINMISTAIPADRMMKIGLQGGSFGMRQLHAAAGGQFGSFGILGETYQLAADGFKRLPGGVKTPIGRSDYLVKGRWISQPGKSWYQALQFKFGQMNEDSDETYLGLTEEDFREDPLQRYAASAIDNITARQRQYNLQYSLSDNRHWNFQATVYRNEFYRNWYKMDYVVDAGGNATGAATILDEPDVHRRSLEILRGADTQGSERVAVKANQRDYYAQGIQAVAGYRFSRGGWRHRVDLGYRYHEDAMDRFQWVDLYGMTGGLPGLREKGQPGTESNRIESARAHAAFLQYRIENGRWTFIPGLRFEDIRMGRSDYGKNDPDRTGIALTKRENRVRVWIPGMGIHYALTPETDLFGGIHRGFAPPGSRPGTLPEFSINYEAGVRQRWSGGEAQITGFFNDYSNLLGLDLLAGGGAGTQDLFNGGEATLYGLELSASFDPFHLRLEEGLHLPFFIAYTFSHGRFDNPFESEFEPWGSVQAGDELPYLAPHQLAWSMGVEWGAWAFAVNGKWSAAMRTVAGQGSIPGDRIIPAYHVTDAALQWQWTEALGLSFRVQNIFDERYLVARRPAGLRPAMPRMILLGMQWRL